MSRSKMSERNDPIASPRDREKAISCAYLRHLGHTQAAAASATGIDPRTLGRWEACSWWPDVQREAAERWLAGLASRARRSLETAVETDGRLALSVLERLDIALAPPKLQAAVAVDGADSSSGLLRTVFWKYVISMHVGTGVSVAVAIMDAKNNPDEVAAWAGRQGLLKSGEIVQ